MHFQSTVLAILGLALSPFASAALGNANIVIYAWPVSDSSPRPLAEFHLTPHPSSPKATLLSYTPPEVPADEQDQLVRIGLVDAKTNQWTGTATTLRSFEIEYDRTFTVRVDEQGEVTGIGYGANPVPIPKKMTKKERKEEEKKAKKDKSKQEEFEKKKKLWRRPGETKLEVVMPSIPPQPALNKPVQLNPDGKLDEAPKDEKSFLQK
jgi:hypothetical protein